MTQRSCSVRRIQCSAPRRAALFLAPLLALALALLLPLGRGTARAESVPDFRVIVNPDNPSTSLSREFLIDAFLKRTTRWNDGETIRPVDQRSDSYARRRFSDSILQRSVAAVKSYWQQRIFSGRELPPPELDSDESVVSYVVKHRGAVGYVSGTAKLDRAKAVQVQ
jgi:ABC-type phosphate transport system substrate-binding protein